MFTNGRGAHVINDLIPYNNIRKGMGSLYCIVLLKITKQNASFSILHMLCSNSVNELPILQRSGWKKGGFTIFQKDTAKYPHTFSGLTTVIIKWTRQCLTWVNMFQHLNYEKVNKEVNKISYIQVFTAVPS